MYWLGQFRTVYFNIQTNHMGETAVAKKNNGLGYIIYCGSKYTTLRITLITNLYMFEKHFGLDYQFTFGNGLTIGFYDIGETPYLRRVSFGDIIVNYQQREPYEVIKNKTIYEKYHIEIYQGLKNKSKTKSKFNSNKIKWCIGILTTGLTAILLGRWFKK